MTLGLSRSELRDAVSSEAWELGRSSFLGHAGGPARTSVTSATGIDVAGPRRRPALNFVPRAALPLVTV
jgi:hypothetical protein